MGDSQIERKLVPKNFGQQKSCEKKSGRQTGKIRVEHAGCQVVPAPFDLAFAQAFTKGEQIFSVPKVVGLHR